MTVYSRLDVKGHMQMKKLPNLCTMITVMLADYNIKLVTTQHNTYPCCSCAIHSSTYRVTGYLVWLLWPHSNLPLVTTTAAARV